jgi:hypothetical protein
MWQIERWVEELHARGFDVEEMDIVTTDEGRKVRLRPVVVEAGHHARQLRALTNLEVEEAQAARLLQDIASFAAHLGMAEAPREVVAMRWLTEIYRPVTEMMPPEMKATVSPAQFFHEMLVHRWYLSEQAGEEVDTFVAAEDLITRFGQTIAATGVPDPAS